MNQDLEEFRRFLQTNRTLKITVGADDLLWETTVWMRKKYQVDIPIGVWWEHKHAYHKVFGVTPEEAYYICERLHQEIAAELTLATGSKEALMALIGRYGELSLITLRLCVLEDLTNATVQRLLPGMFADCFVCGPTGPGQSPRMSYNQACLNLGSQLTITSSLSAADAFSAQDDHWAMLIDHPINEGEIKSLRTIRFSSWTTAHRFLLA